ncbi:MAG: hypothetical protein R2706_15340 [Acidimicrobiales bacterium]
MLVRPFSVWPVGGSSSALGAAEAVFRAARVVKADPFYDLAVG